jgi:hypothetical protein
MKSFSEISILVFILCFCYVKNIDHDKGVEYRKYPIIDSYSKGIDIEEGFLLISNEDFPYGSINKTLSGFVVKKPDTTPQEHKNPLNFNTKTPKLNLFTIDIPPPCLNNFF